ncbi:MAG TPA: cyclase family protein, partial [Gemmatimonadaceae bacterium]
MGAERRSVWRGRIITVVMALGGGALACTSQQLPTPDSGTPRTLIATGWIDATATLDPATTPIYVGDAPLKFEFLKDMRKGDGFTLSAYSMGAHSGTHIDAPMHFVRDGASIEQLSLAS